MQAANPKLTGKDLDATIAQVMQNQQQKALILLGRAKGGENFATLCNENTDDITSKIKKNGGDLGFQERGQLIPQFADAVWGLKAGDVLPKLVKTGLGFQIIKVSAREKPGTLPLDDVRPLIEEKVKQDKVQLAVNNWINDRRRSVKIEFSPRFIAAATKADSAKVATP